MKSFYYFSLDEMLARPEICLAGLREWKTNRVTRRISPGDRSQDE